MSEKFDNILDECIDRIAAGDSVEDCLALYPDLAAELEPELRTILQLHDVSSTEPTQAAKNIGRMRLQQELRAQEDRELAKSQQSWLRGFLGGRPRWATAALALVLTMAVGTSGAVAASSDANPGDVFYPVKRTKENVQLAFEFSPKDKAQLHLVLADRRAQEMERVAEKGNVAHLEPLQRDMQRNLEAVTAIVSALEDLDSVAAVNSMLEVNASATLADLQIALSKAPESVQREVASVLAASGVAFSEAVETVGARAPAPGQSNEPGLVEIRVSIPPPSGVEHAYIEIAGIQAFRVHPQGGQWVDISTETYIFDLVDVGEVQRILAEQEVPPGPYSQVRFSVTGATVVANGMEHEVRPEAGQITLKRPFKVQPGKTTTILLDFDGSRTLRQIGQDQFALDPQVRVEALEPQHQNRLLAQEIRKLEQKAKNEGQSPVGGPPLPRIAVEGVVGKVEGDRIYISGKPIKLPPGVAPGEVAPGQNIRVEAKIQRDGSLEIDRMAPAPPTRRPVPTSGPQGRPSSPRQQGTTEIDRPREGSTPPSREGQPVANVVQFSGIVRSMDAQLWVIGNREVRIADLTSIEGEPTVGSSVSVEGVIRAGRIIASHIENQEAPASSAESTPLALEPQSQAPRIEDTPGRSDAPVVSSGEAVSVPPKNASGVDRPNPGIRAQDDRPSKETPVGSQTSEQQLRPTNQDVAPTTGAQRPTRPDAREVSAQTESAETEQPITQDATQQQSDGRGRAGDKEAVTTGEKQQAKKQQAGPRRRGEDTPISQGPLAA